MTGRPRKRVRGPDLRTWQERQPEPGTPPSPRELEIVQLVAVGLSNAEIGRRLYLAEDTVKHHVRRVMIRLGARNRAHVVWLAVQRGYLQFPKPPHGGDEQ